MNDDVPVRILMVCTANICRSPTAAITLRRMLGAAGWGVDLVHVESAGVNAEPGMPMCDESRRLMGPISEAGGDHRSRLLTEDLVGRADLILTAAKAHRGEIISRWPVTRTRVFTLRQGAALAAWIAGESGILALAGLRAVGSAPALPEGDFREATPPLPDGPAARWRWLQDEMDADRGLAPGDTSATATRWGVDDVGDPHVLGWEEHPAAVDAITEACGRLADAMTAVARWHP